MGKEMHSAGEFCGASHVVGKRAGKSGKLKENINDVQWRTADIREMATRAAMFCNLCKTHKSARGDAKLTSACVSAVASKQTAISAATNLVRAR
jgi:hypothetical protein